MEVPIIDVFGLICYIHPENFWVKVHQGDLVAEKVGLAIICKSVYMTQEYQTNSEQEIEPALIKAFKHL